GTSAAALAPSYGSKLHHLALWDQPISPHSEQTHFISARKPGTSDGRTSSVDSMVFRRPQFGHLTPITL
ncbi:MAG: hypothetical protein OSA99_20770, partial [Acidimicrobiales bacterium]|nr:hypothetical protein [Acidimicrobiales bacterium]